MQFVVDMYCTIQMQIDQSVQELKEAKHQAWKKQALVMQLSQLVLLLGIVLTANATITQVVDAPNKSEESKNFDVGDVYVAPVDDPISGSGDEFNE